MDFLGGSVVKNLPVMQETQEMQVQSLGQEDPLEEVWQPTPVFLPGESHGQRSLEGYGLQGHEESDMTDVASMPMSNFTEGSWKGHPTPLPFSFNICL